jgi:hypothetical protein
MKTVPIRIDENDLVIIDRLAEQSNMTRSEYMRVSALNRRTRSAVNSSLTDYTFLSEMSSMTNLILSSMRSGEDTILDIRELKEKIDQRLALCLEK